MPVTSSSRPLVHDPIARDALAIGLAVGVVGISFGALADAAGLSPAQALACSLLVFTGASQFAFVGVLAGGGATLAALAPAIVLAARNGLYGLALVPVVGGGSRLRRLALAHLVIDESTAMARAQRDLAGQRRALLATGLGVLVFWNLGTAVGLVAGSVLGDPRALGLDAVFPAAFIALLLPRLRARGAAAMALAGAAIATLLVPLAPAGVPVAAAAAGVLARRRHDPTASAGEAP